MRDLYVIVPDKWIGPYEVSSVAEPIDESHDYLVARRGGETVLLGVCPALADAWITTWLHDTSFAEQFHHPNLARLVDLGNTEAQVYFAQEYVVGVSVARLIGRLPIDVAIGIALQVCDGLDYAHDFRLANTVHGRLTPPAIVVGRDGTVKIYQLGIRLPVRIGVKATRPRMFHHLAPEQCRGLPLDRRADIYAVGAILWEMTVGAPRFACTDPFDVLCAIAKQDPVAPSARRPDYPPALERVVMRALARDPDRRYPTMAAMRHDLLELGGATRFDIAAFVDDALATACPPTE